MLGRQTLAENRAVPFGVAPLDLIGPLPEFVAGEPLSAAKWNALAQRINQLWDTQAVAPLKLTKGEPWLLSVDSSVPQVLWRALPACDDGVDVTVWIPTRTTA